MSTALEYFSPEYLIPWGNDDMRLRMLEYVRGVQEAELYLQFGEVPLQVDTLAELTVDGGADAAISVANDGLRAVAPRVYGRLRALTYNSTDQIFASTIYAGLPYEAAAGVTYHVGLRYGAYPTESRLSDAGAYELVRWKEGIGESGQPLSVTDNGDGTLTFLLATRAEAGVGPLGGRPWPETNGGTRLVRIWLSDPVTGYIEASGSPVGQALHTAATNSDGDFVTVTVGHTFGQGATPSTDAADYRVLVHGLSIWRAADRNLLTYTEGSPTFRPYVYLGAVTDGAADTSAAPSSPSLGIVRFDLLQLAADLYDDPHIDGDGLANLALPMEGKVRMAHTDLSRALAWGHRPSIHLGRGKGPADVRTWARDVTISDTGSSRRLTWNGALPTGHLFVTPDGTLASGAKMRPCVGLIDDHVDFPEASANDTYVVFLLATETATTPDGEVVEAALTIATLSAWTTSYPFSVALMTFTWANPTLTPTYLDVARLYLPAPHGEAGLMLRDSASSGGNAVFLDVRADIGSRPTVRVQAFPAGTDYDPNADERTYLLLSQPGAVTRRMEVVGTNGEGAAMSTSVLERLFGANWKEVVTENYVEWNSPAASTAKLRLYKDGGAQDSADADAQKPYLAVGDLKLLGTKTIDVEVPLDGARDVFAGGAWAMDVFVPGYLSTTVTTDVAWLPLSWRVGQTFLGFRVRGFISSPTAGDKLYARIVKQDATTTDGSSAYQTLEGGGAPTAVEWPHTDVAPTQRNVLLAIHATLTAGQRYRLELTTTIDGGATVVVTEVLAVFRFTEL